jgi:polyketide cyclase/dehydrase/lipid transport protein
MRSSADAVYSVIRDYHRRQGALTENFRDYQVEEGGDGDGTVVSYTFHAGHTERHYRLRSSEDAATRTLRERDEHSTFQATWIVRPAESGSVVAVTCEWDGADGVAGVMERTFAPPGLRRIYGQVLEQLDELAS